MRKRLSILMCMLAPLLSYAGNVHYEGSSTIGRFISDAAVVYDPSTFTIDVAPGSLGGEQFIGASATGLEAFVSKVPLDGVVVLVAFPQLAIWWK